mgnify:CR=1 FL=1
MRLFKWHKRLTDNFMERLGLDWYAVAWISWSKGLITGFILCYFLLI